jgi:hypothetical protein
MGSVRLWSASSLKVDTLATDRRMYAGIKLSSIPSRRHPTATATSDPWQFRMPECLQVLGAVRKNIGIPTMSCSAVRPGDSSIFRDPPHAADLIVGASLQVVKVGKGPIVPFRRPPAGAKLDKEKACTLVVVSSV